MLWPDIIQFGRITSDVITGMSVTDFTTVGHMAPFDTQPVAFSLFLSPEGQTTNAFWFERGTKSHEWVCTLPLTPKELRLSELFRRIF